MNFFYFEISKDGSVFMSCPRKQSCWRESQCLCITFIEGKLKDVELQTKMLHLMRELPECTKQLDFLIFYDVADVKQCFHRSFQDCNWCLRMISNKIQLTVSQPVYIVVKNILIIKHLIKNVAISVFLVQIIAFISMFLQFPIWQLWKWQNYAAVAHVHFFPTLVGAVGKDKSPLLQADKAPKQILVQCFVLLEMN